MSSGRGWSILCAALLGACTAAPGAEITSVEVTSAEANEATELSLPIDARTLVSHLAARGITAKADVLAALPAQLKTHFVLVKASGGLQAATPSRPRVVHFTEDARFIVASSGVASDPASSTLEIMELDETAKAYRTHTLTLDPDVGPQLVENDPRCARCHGTPARPIWGEYPNWPSTYGGSQGHEGVDRMTPAELADFDAFVAAAATDPDYRHLRIDRSSYGYHLPTPYGYPNTLLTARVGVRYATTLAARLLASPRLETLAYALVARRVRCTLSAPVEQFLARTYQASLVDPSSAATEAAFPARYSGTKLFRLLGVDPATDLRMDRPLTSPPHAGYEVGYDDWNAGGDDLARLADFEVFRRLLASDPVLAGHYRTTLPRVDAIETYAYQASAATLGALTSSSRPLSYGDSVFPFFYYEVDAPVLNPPGDAYPGEGKKAVVCAHLDAKQRARQ